MKPLGVTAYFNSFYFVHIAGAVCAASYFIWCAVSHQYGDLGLDTFFPVLSGVYITLFAMWYACEKRNIPLPLSSVLFWALVIRVIGLFTYPILEDDFFRYMWDGYQTLVSGSPYAHPPSYFFESEVISPKLDGVLDVINYPDIPTIYGPVTQYVFAFSAWVSVGEVWPLQVSMTLFDLIVIGLLCKKAKPIYILLYAWNPLVIKEIVITAHPDIIPISFMLAAFFMGGRRLMLAAVFCGLAVSAKVFAILLVPFILRFNFKAWSLFLLVLVFTFVPFYQDMMQWYLSLSAMGQSWFFNSPIYITVSYFISFISLTYLKYFLLTCFVAFWLVLYIRFIVNTESTSTVLPRGDLMYFWFLLAIPVANPWYFLWILPFAVIYPSVWAWTASGAVMLSYIIGLNMPSSGLGNYQQPYWAVALEYGLILAGAIYGIHYKLRHCKQPRSL